MPDEYVCPICCQELKNDPEHPQGMNEDGAVWPSMVCLNHGMIGRRPYGVQVPVGPLLQDGEF